ncbi:histone-lysine N-methyltransferase ATXR3-like isoform X2 [Mangifera indica]|uniref:histone-lysine N-methyltransferase ATXR3-like isoform X2 n=1 Tax=Mangifera indica TaxID=29780 RepID=UPI001CF9E74F|nr:histone-lysine N-methyltransferase ATXR3-like isoform X2 [Mangifera indica]
MGDGGVACMSLQQQQQHNSIMERFPMSDKAICVSNSNNKTNNNNATNNNSSSNNNDTNNGNNNNKDTNNSSNKKNGVTSKIVKKKIVKIKKIVSVKKKEVQKNSGSNNNKAVGNGGGSGGAGGGDSVSVDKDKVKGEEVEEGELGTLKWENGEFVQPEKSQSQSQSQSQVQSQVQAQVQAQFQSQLQSQSKRGETEKGEIIVSTSKCRRGETEKGEFGLWKGNKDDVEKCEFIPDRWHKGEVVKDDYGYSKSRRYDSKLERTPPYGKYSSEDAYRRKEFERSGNQHSKNSTRWETGQDRNIRISSKIVDDEVFFKGEYSNGKNHGREYSSGNRLKRHGADSDSCERKYYVDYGDFASSKSRRLSDDYNTRAIHSEHYSRHSVERFYKNSSSSRVSSSDKYSSRYHESSSSSRVVYDRHGRSPCHSERSPRERGRYYDYRDRSPGRRDRSPHTRDRSPYTRDKSPYARDRSPYAREKSPYAHEKSPYVREKSPYDRNRHYDHRTRSPINADRSPQDRARLHDRRDRTPNYLERSPLDRNRPNNHREANRKSGASEKRNSQFDNKGPEDKLGQKDSTVLSSHSSAKESQDNINVEDLKVPDEKNAKCESHKEEPSLSSNGNCRESPHVDGLPPEELLSMEEDMDISDTPPHVPTVVDSSAGKWFYLDHYGFECGPSKLCDLKELVEEGVLASDHFVKHLDSDRWVTVENAVSPLVTVNFSSVVSDAVTQLVSPPEAPGNLLADTGDIMQPRGEEFQLSVCAPDDSASVPESIKDLNIDVRIGALLEGFTLIPGKEIETLGEILQTVFEPVEWQNCGGFTLHGACIGDQEQNDQKTEELSKFSDSKLKEAAEFRLGVIDKDTGLACFDIDDWFSGRWSCKGGDWKRNDDAGQDKISRKKLVLNDGFSLCHMPKSGFEDPRWPHKDDLYYPSHSRRLDLPLWAFSCLDERNDGSSVNRATQTKPAVVRGVKGTMLPVVRINACVVNDHGSFVSEPRLKVRGKERCSSKSARPYSSASDARRSSVESVFQSKTVNDSDLQCSWKSVASINTPKDRVCTVEDLQLHLGEWYYLDGTGHERGPSSFSELQVLVDQGVIQKHISVFRKFDKVWVPITSAVETSESASGIQQEHVTPSSHSSGHSITQSQGVSLHESESSVNSSSFHGMHPQYIGYTCGKLHELVMKSYRSREFAAAINEVLDPWINAKQPKKETEKHLYRISEGDARAGKRARLLVDESEEDDEMEDVLTIQDESTFEDLCGDASFPREESAGSETESGSWGLLDGHMLARIFHFLRSDIKSLTIASLTCKQWRAAARFYKDISRQVDLSSVGPNCTDSAIGIILNGYNKEKLNSMVLVGCTNVTSGMLEEVLRSFPCLSYIDIRGCSQFGDLAHKFPNMNWLKSQNSHGTKISNESHSKIRSLKQITEKNSSVSKTKGLGGDMDDFSELKDYFESVDKRDSANQLFRRSLYQRSKVFDARKSSSIVSRDARMRRWAIKKSENGYKRMEEFLALSLKDIMKENTFDFFVPKVAEIEEKMKNGYYSGHGLSSVKDDISRMCRDAIKAKNRGGARDMNHIITLFIQLATHLEQGARSSYYEREEMMKFWKDESHSGFSSASSKYKRKLSKSERKYMNRSNGSYFANGDFDYGEYASDREIRKRLSKLNRKSMDSGSETSDDIDRSSEDGKGDSESTVSDTDSDSDFRSEGRAGESRGDGYFTADEGLSSITDDREWGARMTKASLVPPVTRKYEVIDQYVIVADEEDVKRKMRVSLPEDYVEKLNAQKNGSEELDMELPEVKDYKPRKQLGDQVLEQEVYGIDPYTHNLLLDSMPEELDWSLNDKHMFIEDVLLRTLNKQVRHYTGSGNTPMMYHLLPVVEEIEKVAEEDCDVRTMKICQGILKAIDSRLDDKYVAYRKGLGVVCNKDGGFGEDDFVVEFLGEVYPVWKWFEKQDGIRSLQKNKTDPAPEFYNIYLERPKGDGDGYDLVVVDAMHKANYASRICHSCRPNCEAKVTAVDGQYQIGIYTVREIQYGEEITFDYNSVTESKEEYEASVCLCGSQVCRGSYLNLTGEGAFEKVLEELHGLLDRHQLMLEACELNSVTEEDYLDLGRAGLGNCLLGGLPSWVVAYSARLVRFINLERTKLPEEILKHNLEEKRKYFSEICLEVEKSDAEVQAEGVYNQRLQNLAVTLDKVRYVMRCVFGDPKKAPPPLEKLSPEETVSFLWKGEGSLVEELLECMAPHVEVEILNDLKSKIHAHDPSDSDDIQKELQKSLLWLRDEVRNLPCTYKCRHDAAADLIHIYAYTKCFFRVREYKAFTSPPVYISPLDLGPKYTDKLGTGLQEYRKTYGENYCLGQLIFWHIQSNTDPDCSLARGSRGCLSLPEIGSFYAKVQKPSRQRVYGPRTVRFMLSWMEKHPQRPWPKDRIWSFKRSPQVYGSPMLDAILKGCPLDREMVHWLKHRPAVYQAMWDR